MIPIIIPIQTPPPDPTEKPATPKTRGERAVAAVFAAVVTVGILLVAAGMVLGYESGSGYFTAGIAILGLAMMVVLLVVLWSWVLT